MLTFTPKPGAPEPEEDEQRNERGRSESRPASIREGQRTSHGKDREQRRKSSVCDARRSSEYHTCKGDGAGDVRIVPEGLSNLHELHERCSRKEQ